MSAALVRKALEISAESELPPETKSKKKKAKQLKIKKKKTPEEIKKHNLKILKALAGKSRTVKSSSTEDISKKKKKKEKTAFTEEDFAKFEQEYFVTE